MGSPLKPEGMMRRDIGGLLGKSRDNGKENGNYRD